MDFVNQLSSRIQAASGEKPAQLVLKHANVVNVFTGETECLDIAVTDGYIAGLGSYDGIENVDLTGFTVCPGFIDGHIHLESSMVVPSEFQKAVLPHGTTAVITDPHEIANVAGTDGIDYMMEAAKALTLDVFFMLPSCVPAGKLDESGAVLLADSLKPYYDKERVLGLAELMDFYGTVRADKNILDKIQGAVSGNACIDGHGPSLHGKELNAYITAGVRSDHECSTAEEAMEKLKRGQWIMIRQGTAAKNLDALMPLFEEPYYHRCMLVTDDKHPGDLIQEGHIDAIIRQAVSKGADVIHAIQMATLHAAQCFGLKDRGAVAPGYLADLVIVSDLEHFEVRQVYKAGRLVAKQGVLLDKQPAGAGPEDGEKTGRLYDKVTDSFHIEPI